MKQQQKQQEQRFVLLLLLLWNAFSSVVVVAQQDTTSCTLCFDGDDPINDSSDPIVPTDDEGLSCSSLFDEASTTEVTDTCQTIQLAAFQGDCCDSVDLESCSICGDMMTMMNQMRDVPSTEFDNLSCINLMNDPVVQGAYLKSFFTSLGSCEDTLLRRSAAWCGCQGVELECSLCDTTDDTMEDDDINYLDRVHPLTGQTCGEFSYQYSILKSEECSSASQIIGFDPKPLCCPNVPNWTICEDFCSEEGYQFVIDEIVDTPTYGPVLCADVAQATFYISNENDCENLRQEVGESCCRVADDDDDGVTTTRPVSSPSPQPPPPPTSPPLAPTTNPGNGDDGDCVLTCPNGAPLPDPSKTDPITGRSCQDFANAYASLSSSEECSSAVLGFDAVAFCCPTVDPPGECRICETTSTLLYPERILFTFEEHSCETLDTFLTHITHDAECWQWLDASRALSNCPCRQGGNTTPAEPPTPTPSDTEPVGSGTAAGNGSMWLGNIMLLSILVVAVVATS